MTGVSEQGRLFTSESVTEGHPDKICDAIRDSGLDALLAGDPRSRVAVETAGTTGQVHVIGEVTTTAKEAFADISNTVRERILDIGYDHSDKGFDGATCGVNLGIGRQSPDIAQGVDTAHETRVEGAADPLDSQGAGDQGLMFGYAISDTPELMPLPIALAHRLARRLTEAGKNGTLPYLRPDGKTQVTIEYEDNVPTRLDTVVVSTQHADGIDLIKTLDPDIRKHVLATVIEELGHQTLDSSSTRVLVNPTGKFVVGGPMGDAGLTGRKIIVDTYGGRGPHGGGAFSGQNPTQVDPPRAHAPRDLGRNVGRAGLARRCEVQIAYAIGVAQPVGVHVNTFGTGTVDEEVLEKYIQENFQLTPKGIIESLNLRRPIFKQTAAYGHFGRTGDAFTWEATDKAAALKSGAAAELAAK